jgi:perosamine synthetase
MIRLAYPQIPDRAGVLIDTALKSGMLTSGKLVGEFESRLSELLGGAQVVATTNGTAAAGLAFALLHQRGARVALVPDFLFPSVAAAALMTGISLHAYDIHAGHLGLSPDLLSALPPGPETVVVSIDQFGIPGPNEELETLVNQHNWQWFEDAACALGSCAGNTPCGSRATVAILSFHPRKVLTTAEGGALVTRDAGLAQEARTMRNLGMSGTGVERGVTRLAGNARLSELHAAIGLAQLDVFSAHLERRRELGRHYLSLLAERTELTVPAGFADPGSNFQSMIVLLPESADRSQVAALLQRQGVESTVPGFALHTQPVFAGLLSSGAGLDNDAEVQFTNSRHLHHRGLALPLHERMDRADVETVLSALATSLHTSKEPA